MSHRSCNFRLSFGFSGLNRWCGVCRFRSAAESGDERRPRNCPYFWRARRVCPAPANRKPPGVGREGALRWRPPVKLGAAVWAESHFFGLESSEGAASDSAPVRWSPWSKAAVPTNRRAGRLLKSPAHGALHEGQIWHAHGRSDSGDLPFHVFQEVAYCKNQMSTKVVSPTRCEAA